MPELKKFPRRFVATDADFSEVSVVENAYDEAMKQSVETLDELERFVSFWMEVMACIDEARSKNYVAMTCDTTDKEAEALFLSMVENVMPVLEAKDFEMKKKFVASPAVNDLPERYEVFVRDVKNEIELFREENIPLQIEGAKLGQNYQKNRRRLDGELGGRSPHGAAGPRQVRGNRPRSTRASVSGGG